MSANGLSVAVVGQLAAVPAPGTDDQFGFCATPGEMLFECTLVLSRGAAAVRWPAAVRTPLMALAQAA